MSVDFRIVSIGTLSSNPFWHEGPGGRTAHATTTLIREDGRVILVDPSLPAPALVARLFERTGLAAGDVTDVFCTTLRPVHRRSIEAFGSARWLCAEAELQTCTRQLDAMAAAAERIERPQEALIADERRLVGRFAPAPDRLTRSVHLFPLPGPSAGSAGLLLAAATRTVMIAGDAAITSEHVEAGRVWTGCADAEAAKDSLREIVEIADLIVCGHDNLMLSPVRWGV